MCAVAGRCRRYRGCPLTHLATSMAISFALSCGYTHTLNPQQQSMQPLGKNLNLTQGINPKAVLCDAKLASLSHIASSTWP